MHKVEAFPWNGIRNFITRHNCSLKRRETTITVGVKDDDYRVVDHIAIVKFGSDSRSSKRLIQITGRAEKMVFDERVTTRIDLDPYEARGLIQLPDGMGKVFLRERDVYFPDEVLNPETYEMAEGYVRTYWLVMNHIINADDIQEAMKV